MNKKVRSRFSFKKVLSSISLLILIGAGLFYLGYRVVLQKKIMALTPQQKKVLIFGHAGSGFLSPFNPFNPLPASSMTSVLKALADGADGVEVDVQLSKDGVLVMYHDENLESMTKAKGKIEDLPAQEVLGLNYNAGFVYDLFQNEKVVSFEALLQKLQQYPAYPLLHLDLRNYKSRRHDFYARTLVALLDKYQYPVQKITYISPDVDLLNAFRHVQPAATFLVDRHETFENTLQSVLDNKFQGLVLNSKEVDVAKMEKLRALGLQVVLFGPKAPASIYKVITLQPDAVEVNNVKAMYNMVR